LSTVALAVAVVKERRETKIEIAMKRKKTKKEKRKMTEIRRMTRSVIVKREIERNEAKIMNHHQGLYSLFISFFLFN
jgi:hypothetical protein